MRPSSHLIALVLAMAALTVLVSVWWRDMTMPLLFLWTVLAIATAGDLVLSAFSNRMMVDFDLPPQGFVGRSVAFAVAISPRKGSLPANIDIRLDAAPELVIGERQMARGTSGDIKASFDLQLTRRGQFRSGTSG